MSTRTQTFALTSAGGPVGSFTHATHRGDTIYLTRQIPTIPETCLLVKQTRKVFMNFSTALIHFGAMSEDSLIFLTDFDTFNIENVSEFEDSFRAAPASTRKELPSAPSPTGPPEPTEVSEFS